MLAYNIKLYLHAAMIRLQLMGKLQSSSDISNPVNEDWLNFVQVKEVLEMSDEIAVI